MTNEEFLDRYDSEKYFDQHTLKNIIHEQLLKNLRIDEFTRYKCFSYILKSIICRINDRFFEFVVERNYLENDQIFYNKPIEVKLNEEEKTTVERTWVPVE